MRKLYFDFDGVIRDLSGAIFGKAPATWTQTIDGLSFYEYVRRNMHVLINAKPTQYRDTIEKYRPTIISHQPNSWRKSTLRWLAWYVSSIEGIIFVDDPNDKFNYVGKDDILVEDSPNFEKYFNIILIDWPYNRTVQHPLARVRTPLELQSAIERFL